MSPEFTPKDVIRGAAIFATSVSLYVGVDHLASASEPLHLSTPESTLVLPGREQQAQQSNEPQFIPLDVYYIQKDASLSAENSLATIVEQGYSKDDLEAGFEIIKHFNGDTALIPTVRVKKEGVIDPKTKEPIPVNSLLAEFNNKATTAVMVFPDQDGADNTYNVSFLILGAGALDTNTKAFPTETYTDKGTGKETPINFLGFVYDNEKNVFNEVKTSLREATVGANNLRIRNSKGEADKNNTLSRGTKVIVIDPENKTYTFPSSDAPNATFVAVIFDGKIAYVSKDLLNITDSPVPKQVTEVATEAAPGTIETSPLITLTSEPSMVIDKQATPEQRDLSDLGRVYDQRITIFGPDNFYKPGKHVGFTPFKLTEMQVYKVDSTGGDLYYAEMMFAFKNANGVSNLKTRAYSIVGGTTAIKVKNFPNAIGVGNNYQLRWVLYPNPIGDLATDFTNKCNTLPSAAKINANECLFRVQPYVIAKKTMAPSELSALILKAKDGSILDFTDLKTNLAIQFMDRA